MDYKKLTSLQLVKGLTLINTLAEFTEDEEKAFAFAAIYLADDETLKKARKDPSALLPYVLQAEQLEPEALAGVIDFFSMKILDFSALMQKTAKDKLEKEKLLAVVKK